MLLEIFGFMHMSAADILDILMVAGIIYLAFRWIRGSAAMNIFIALMTLFLLRVVVAAFNMKLMSALLGTFIDVGVLALIVIFQPEIRHFLNRLGAHRLARTSKSFLGKLLGISEKGMDSEVVKEITEACRSMSESKTGALIVLPHKTPLEYIIETGDRIDSLVNRRLLMNLFFKNSPLHDRPLHPAHYRPAGPSGPLWHAAQGRHRRNGRYGCGRDCGVGRDGRRFFRARRSPYAHRQHQRT